ncbi:uncharacterized protein LOC122499063 [Leptopilina heterotoma]|uniref:uncharacterized protein LOC122499063 n=1 Tax=Leptopilina heterotoma TaxID=63436 RepID=UPI001CA8BDA0|nr:uncharacterized protein LOC122499063 [Leptopilina heterotoma]XP_043463068.1 uncharacterized protein LOC122499063 [Leptopilina heterotoma]XP_043463069.1 uncharacterized protein LOC122499063 [Leptopilina heterotoma]
MSGSSGKRSFHSEKNSNESDLISWEDVPPEEPSTSSRSRKSSYYTDDDVSSAGRDRQRKERKIEHGRSVLPIIKRGVMFGNLKPIPTDPRVDPPLGSCISCWKMGHKRSDCPNPQYGYCRNCGRRGVTMTECPRCADQHRIDMLKKYGKTNYNDFRSERIAKVKDRMTDSGKLSVQEKLKRDVDQGSSVQLIVKKLKRDESEVEVITIPKQNILDVGRGTQMSKVVKLERPEQIILEKEKNDERRESTEEEELDRDEAWELLEQVPTATLIPPKLPVDMSIPPPNWALPSPTIAPPMLPTPVTHQNAPIPTFTQPPPMISQPPIQKDDTDRFIEQTRSLVQALAGLPADAVTLAMKEFYEERRRVIDGRKSTDKL